MPRRKRKCQDFVIDKKSKKKRLCKNPVSKGSFCYIHAKSKSKLKANPEMKKGTVHAVKAKTKTKQRKVAILFLAHEGLTIPRWWQEWIEDTKDDTSLKENILLYVATQDRKYVPEGHVWHWAPLSRNPTWCDISQVWALQEGLRKILMDDKEQELEGIYFISGAELVFYSPQQLYKKKIRTNIAIRDKDIADALPRGNEFWDILKDTKSQTYQDLKENVTKLSHNAAMSLTRDDAKLIADFPEAKLISLHKLLDGPLPITRTKRPFQEDLFMRYSPQVIQRIKERQESWEKETNPIKKRELEGIVNTLKSLLEQLKREDYLLYQMKEEASKKSFEGSFNRCMDENLPALILLISGRSTKDIRGVGIVEVYRATGFSSLIKWSIYYSRLSPITFEEWDTPYLLYDESFLDKEVLPYGKTIVRSLKELVERMCKTYDPDVIQKMFIRKIGKNVHFNGKPWRCSS